MSAPEKQLQDFVAEIQRDAAQEAVNALGRDLIEVISRHGFQLSALAKSPSSANRKPSALTGRQAPTRLGTKAASVTTREPPPETDTGRVLQTIRANQGLTSALVKVAAESNGKPIHIKTFKTAINRLKKRGLIRAENGRYYSGEAKPSKTAA